MSSIKNGVWLKAMPSPAHEQGTEHGYPEGWGPTIDTSTEDSASSACTNTEAKSAFPNGQTMGMWVDEDELRRLHPRAAWLLDGAGER